MLKHRYCPICKGNLLSKKAGNLTRRVCSECGWVYYANPLPSAVAFVYHEGHILLIKRGAAPQKGSWALPSGFVEPNELPEETVLRELREETSTKGVLENLIGVYTRPTKLHGNVILIAYAVKYVAGKPRADTDTIDARFFPANKLPPIPLVGHRAIIRDGIARHEALDARITVLKSKITEAKITHTRLFYKGSMGIDSRVMKAVNLLPGEKVQVLNYDNGERLETYTIEEKAGSGRIVLYGPASRKGEVGQRLCILAYASMNYPDARNNKPLIVTLDKKNRIKRR
jgi:aspartate 1-decarboxylase